MQSRRAQARFKFSDAATAAVLALTCAISHGQTAPPAPLTLQQAVAIARNKNPTLLAAEQNLLSTKALELQAAVRQNPYFTAYGANITNPATAVTPYSYSLQLARLFERGQKRRWRIDSADSTADQTSDLYRDQERGVVLQVKQAFTTMLLAKAELKLAKDNLADFTHELNINRERYKAGDIGKVDYERLDLQLAQFETDESNAEQALAQASDQLQTLLGYEKPIPNFDIAGDIVPPSLNLALPGLEQDALAARPDFRAAQAAILVSDANEKLAYANGTADPTVEGEYDHSGNLSSFGFYVTVPIRIFDRNQGNKESAVYAARGSRFAEVAAKNQVYSDVDQAWTGYLTARVLSDRYHGHYLDEAKDVLSISQFAYKRGGLALIDYLDAIQDDRTVSLAALNAYAQTWLAIHQLSYATATELTP